MKQNNFKLAIVELKNNPEVQSLKSQSVQYNFGIAYTYNQQFKEANQAFMKLGSYKNSKLYLIITLNYTGKNQKNNPMQLIQGCNIKSQKLYLLNWAILNNQIIRSIIFKYKSKKIKPIIGLKLYEDALNIINNIITQFGGDWRMYLCKAFALIYQFHKHNIYCLQQYNEALNAIEVVLQLQGENTLIICNFLTGNMYDNQALILYFCFQQNLIIKLDKKDEANQFFDIIKPQLNNDPNILGYQLIQEQIDQLNIGNIQEYRSFNRLIVEKTTIIEPNSIDKQFKLSVTKLYKIYQLYYKLYRLQIGFIVSVMETMEVSEEDIELKKSKIDSWLLTVDFKIFTQDLWTLFNYDQMKPKE